MCRRMVHVARGHREGPGSTLRASRSAFPLLVALAVAAQVSLAEAPQNDGGMAGDAGGSRATATLIPGPGSYAGELRSQDDDWFTSVRAPSAACVQVDASGDTYANATLAVRTGAASYGVTAPLINGSVTRLAVAGSAVARTWEGFVRTPNPAGYDAARPRYYAFSLSESGTPVGDGGVMGDAGATLQSARPLPGGCSGGRLQPLGGLGDVLDTYAFTLTQAGDVVYSVGANAPIRVDLVDGSGRPVAPSVGVDQVQLVQLPAGTFYLQMSAAAADPDAISYVVALMGPDPPPGSPCRPHCALTE